MPSNLLTADTGFPDLTGEGKSEEKFAKISSYLYMLLEQLKYSMANLDKENFNEAGFNEIVNIITEPVYLQLKDANGNIAALQATAEGLGMRITSAEGNIHSLTLTADSLRSDISTAEGHISTLQQTAESLTSRISDAEGNVSALTQTVNGMTLSVVNGSSSSTIKLLANEAVISSANITFNGVVTFRDLSRVDEMNPTVIHGGNITTGTIKAIDIEGCTFRSVLNKYANQGGEIEMWYKTGDTQYLAGGLYLDDMGDEDTRQSKYRVYLYTKRVQGKAAALKLESEASMSMEANEDVYITARRGRVIINALGGLYINEERYEGNSGGVSWGE